MYVHQQIKKKFLFHFCSCWIKIRITYEDLKQITEFIEFLKQSQAQEALFVYAKLCTDSAFDYVANELPRGLEVKFGRQQYVGCITPFETDENAINNTLKNPFEESVKELDSVDQLYRNELVNYKGGDG